ncbi:hypothetical protein B566_EDAN015106 [Ephemera danica]|nr:hypothetical protein B566_EDAN015106 [Ephemera danica]
MNSHGDEGQDYNQLQMELFIEEVRKNEVLWNEFHSEYRNRKAKKSVWARIDLNTLQYNMTPSVIKFDGGLLVFPRGAVTNTTMQVPNSSRLVPILPAPIMPAPIMPAPIRPAPIIPVIQDEGQDLLPTQMELFIEDVRNNEILWNKMNPDYKNQRLKDRIWLRVGAKYKMKCEYTLATKLQLDLNTLPCKVTPSTSKSNEGPFSAQTGVTGTTVSSNRIMKSNRDEGPDIPTSEMELFIEDVRNNEMLWNRSNPDYKKKRVKDSIWLRVGAKYKMRTNQAQIKWKNLQDRYKKHKKELQTPGREQTITRVWYLYKFLTFIDSGCQSTSGSSYVDQPSESSQTNEDTMDGGNSENNVICSLEEINVKQECCTPDLSNSAEDLNTLSCDITPSTSQSESRASNSHVALIMPVIQGEGQDIPPTQMELFIEEVRNNEILWKELNPKYKNKKAKERIWLRIGAIFNMKYSDCPTTSRLSTANPPSESSHTNEDTMDGGNPETNLCGLEEINVKEEYCTTPDLSNNAEDYTDDTLPCDMSPSTSQSEDIASNSCVAQFMPVLESSYEDEGHDLAPQMEWFIEEVKNNEILWNRFNPDYKNRKLKERVVDSKQTAEAMDCFETLEHQNTTKDEDALFLISHLNDLKSLPPEKKSKFKIEVSSTLHSCDNTGPDMPTVCCIRNCKHSHLNCGLHNFPTDMNQRCRWAANIKQYDKNYQLKTHHRICNLNLSRRNDVLKVKQFLSQNMKAGNTVVLTSNASQETNPAWLPQIPQLAPKPHQKSSQSSSLVLCPPVMPTLTPSVVQHAASSMPSTSQASSVILQNKGLTDQQSSVGFFIPVKPYGNTIFAPTTSQDPLNKKQVCI